MAYACSLLAGLIAAQCLGALGRNVCRWTDGAEVAADDLQPVCCSSDTESEFGLLPGSDLPEIPPIVFVKTHKTGSSTLGNVINRMADRRNMRVMTSEDLCWLGWPNSFPGPHAESPRGQFDVIISHSVFHRARMESYMSAPPVFVTILREPGAQAISAFNYYSSSLKAESPEANTRSWGEHLDYLHGVRDRPTAALGYDFAHFVNPQSYDLGWYQYVNGTTAHDRDDGMITSWLSSMHETFRKSGVAIIAEQFDEGLVLLRRKLKLDLRELAYLRLNDTPERKVSSTEEAKAQMRRLNPVDMALYGHFKRRFEEQWAAGDPVAGQAEVAELRRLVRELRVACQEPMDPVRCPARFRLNPSPYMAHFIAKERLSCPRRARAFYP